MSARRRTERYLIRDTSNSTGLVVAYLDCGNGDGSLMQRELLLLEHRSASAKPSFSSPPSTGTAVVLPSRTPVISSYGDYYI